MSFRAIKELVTNSSTNLTNPNKLLAASIGATALSILSKDKETKEEAAAVAVSLIKTAEEAVAISMCPKKTAFTFIALEAGNRFFGLLLRKLIKLMKLMMRPQTNQHLPKYIKKIYTNHFQWPGENLLLRWLLWVKNINYSVVKTIK